LDVQVTVELVHLDLTIETPVISAAPDDFYEVTPHQNLNMRVTGHLKAMRLSFNRSKERWNLHVPPAAKQVDYVISHSITQWLEVCTVCTACMDYDLDDGETVLAENQIFFYMPWKFGPRWFYCLLLEIVDRDLGIFRRKGILFTGKENEIELLQQEQGNETALPCFIYNEASSQHTIFIC
jgi:hypothetical protein